VPGVNVSAIARRHGMKPSLLFSDVGTIAPAALPPISPQDQIFAEFSDYL